MSSLRPRAAFVVALAVSAVGLPLLTACTDESSPPAPAPTVSTSKDAGSSPRQLHPVVANTVASGLSVPWDLAFVPDGSGSALVTERDTGDVVLVEADGTITSAGTVPGVVADGEGGLLGIALDPNFTEEPWVYVYLTTATDNRVVRMKYDDGSLGALQVVLTGLRKASIHDGGRIRFGPDGYLYVGVGDAGEPSLAQDQASLNGKILRITREGDPAPDNPTADSAVYSSGHRNVQGLGWDSAGRLWASEFGQNTWDELNLIEPGTNYGWPVVEGRAGREGFADPVVQWSTDEASPSGVAVVRDHVVLAALRGERLWVVPLDGRRAGDPRDALAGELGRIRAVEQAPDGSLWVLTNNTDGRGTPRDGDDRIVRVTY